MINVELWEERKKKLGYTFDELSEKSGIPKRTILGVFRKEVTTPRIDTVQAIEKALGLNTPSLEWTDEDKAAGVTFTSPYNNLSKEEVKWFELRSLIIEKQGEEYLNTVIEMLTTLMNQKK